MSNSVFTEQGCGETPVSVDNLYTSGINMAINYLPLRIEMYDQLVKGWNLLPENATGIGDDRESIGNYLTRNRNCSIAAFHGDELIGAVLAGHDGRRALLNHLFVVPDFRRKGVARTLVAMSFKELRKQGVRRAAVFIHKTNPVARSFWENIGFDKVDFIDAYGMDL